MIHSAVQFRGRVFQADCHADALKDCIECADWIEAHWEIERILEEDEEPWAFGYWDDEIKAFKSFDQMEYALQFNRPGERQRAYKEYLL